MKIVFTGIQGCGKGTQARLLVENYGYTIVEMGWEFRKILASGSELAVELKEIMDSGQQVNQKLGWEVMRQAIKNQTSDKIIFDGFIRNDWNKEIFDEVLPEYKVVFFNLWVEKAKLRLLWRMFDPKTGETFMAGLTINPKTGDTLVKRDDDKDETAILKRISEYEEKTLPIVEIQKKEDKIISINADGSIDEVHSQIINALWLK